MRSRESDLARLLWKCERYELAVDACVAIDHLNEHVAKAALPDVSQHAFGCQWQLDLRLWPRDG